MCGPPLFTLLQLEMPPDGARTGGCDRPLTYTLASLISPACGNHIARDSKEVCSGNVDA